MRDCRSDWDIDEPWYTESSSVDTGFCIDDDIFYGEEEFSDPVENDHPDQGAQPLRLEGLFYSKVKTSSQPRINATWNFVVENFFNSPYIRSVMEEVDQLCNKAFMAVNMKTGVLVGYISLKEKMPIKLLTFSFENITPGLTWNFYNTSGGCQDNIKHLNKECKNRGLSVLFNKGMIKDINKRCF